MFNMVLFWQNICSMATKMGRKGVEGFVYIVYCVEGIFNQHQIYWVPALHTETIAYDIQEAKTNNPYSKNIFCIF